MTTARQQDESVSTVRTATRNAWNALLAAQETPSVRKVWRVVGGAYPTVAAECRALRAEAGAVVPDRAQTAPAPQEVSRMRGARPLPRRLVAQLCKVIDEVRANPTYARNLQVRLALFQGSDSGPLTGMIDAMVED